ncbi:cell wall protein IFF6-like [Hyposmocoma kahamanoa]|uniref:cell wall protein IFF6-like n=1 Tax=Hyposmocoma kahamanoa TaxID=1477025 RepID=UPI000E6D6BBF|nr:cell wall protein IFF6-like [Hyposmocoma kahamanoa]
MSWFISLFIAVVLPLVTSEVVGSEGTCVVLNFENGLEDFDDSIDQCEPLPGEWEVGHYEDINIEPPHESSTTFITPNGLSCTSSYEFTINATGNLEVTFYMSTQLPHEFLTVIVNEIQNTGQIGQNARTFTATEPGVNNNAWNTMTFLMGNNGTYTGFVSIMSSKNSGSEILLDNFRYIPPEIEETHEDCVIYDQNTTTEPGDGSTTESGDGTTTEPGDDSTTGSGDGTTTGSDDDTTTGSGDGTTTESDDGTATESGDGTTTESGNGTTTESGDDSTTGSGDGTTTGSGDGTTTGSGDGTTTESDDGTATESGDGTTTESDEDKTTEPYTTTTETTVEPEDPDEKADSFWNPLTITMTVVLIIIPLVGISVCLYEKRKRVPVNEPMFDDPIKLTPTIVPRVKKV